MGPYTLLPCDTRIRFTIFRGAVRRDPHATPPTSMPGSTSTAASPAPQWTWTATFAFCSGMRGRTRRSARRRPARSSAASLSTVRPRSPSTFISGAAGKWASSRRHVHPTPACGRCRMVSADSRNRESPRGRADQHEQGKSGGWTPVKAREDHRSSDLIRRVLPRPGG